MMTSPGMMLVCGIFGLLVLVLVVLGILAPINCLRNGRRE